MDGGSGNRKYSNGEITVHWQPAKCFHAARCISGLPSVFDVAKRPWVNIHGAPTADIKRVVDTCPSGALTWTQD